MYRRNPASKCLPRNMPQTRRLHHTSEINRLRKLQHGLRKIRVSITVTRYHSPNHRQDAREVAEVKSPERLPRWRRELENHQLAAGFQHARQLPIALMHGCQIAHTEADDNAVEFV